jgi:hypothetical protein
MDVVTDRCLLVSAALAIVAAAAGCGGAPAVHPTAGSPTTTPSSSPTAPLTAKLSGPGGQDPVLATLSSADGAIVRRLTRLPSGVDVTGPFASGDGALWYTVTTGPRDRSDVLDSCSSRVVRFDPGTGVSWTVFTAPSSTLLGAAVPNPAGTEVAYLTEGCQDYGGWYLQVRNLRTAEVHSIGQANAPCDNLSEPGWSPDGRSLVFTWAPAAAITRPGPQSACVGGLVPDSTIVVVPVGDAGPIAPGAVADHGCGYTAAAFDRWGVGAVEECGVLGLGSTTFVELDRSLHPDLRLALPARVDGVTVSAAPGGSEVVVDAYQSPGLDAGVPAQWLQIFDGTTLRTLTTVETGNAWPTDATW